MKKLWVSCGVIIVLVGGTASYWKFGRGKNGEVKYRTVAVDRGEITSIVNASGTVNPLVQVDLGSQVSGIVRKLYVDFNDAVKASQLVAEIDPSTYEAQVTQAEANLAKTHADTTNALVALDRTKRLVADKVAAQSDLDSAQARYDMAVAAEKEAQASLDQARTNLRNTKIYSPLDGIVIDRKVQVGQTVAAGLNVAVIYSIANELDHMQIDTLVDEADIGRVKEGQDVDFTVDAYPRETFRGKVFQVRNAPINKQDVINYDVVVRVENPDHKLKPGMTANVSLIVAHQTSALRVPNAALRFKPLTQNNEAANPWAAPHPPAKRLKPDDHVYVLDESGKPKRADFTLGIQDESYSEVVVGLSEGQQIVVGMAFAKGAVVSGAQMPNPWQMRRF